jgi:hypothetical protein
MSRKYWRILADATLPLRGANIPLLRIDRSYSWTFSSAWLIPMSLWSPPAGRRNLPLRLFRMALGAGFAVNPIFICRAFLDPAAILALLDLPPAAANVWLGNTANLMLTVETLLKPCPT